jgi:hypothetical protein
VLKEKLETKVYGSRTRRKWEVYGLADMEGITNIFFSLICT